MPHVWKLTRGACSAAVCGEAVGEGDGVQRRRTDSAGLEGASRQPAEVGQPGWWVWGCHHRKYIAEAGEGAEAQCLIELALPKLCCREMVWVNFTLPTHSEEHERPRGAKLISYLLQLVEDRRRGGMASQRAA